MNNKYLMGLTIGFIIRNWFSLISSVIQKKLLSYEFLDDSIQHINKRNVTFRLKLV